MLFEVLLLLGLHPFTSCTKHWSRKAFPVLILDSNSCHLACTWTNVKGTRMPTQAPTACPQDMRDIIRMVSPRPGGSYFWPRNQITQMSRSQAVLTPLQGDVGSSPPSTCISRVALWRHLVFFSPTQVAQLTAWKKSEAQVSGSAVLNFGSCIIKINLS